MQLESITGESVYTWGSVLGIVGLMLVILMLAILVGYLVEKFIQSKFKTEDKGEDKGEDVEFISFSMVLVGISAIAVPFFAVNHRGLSQAIITHHFAQHIPYECVAAATAADAQRRVECTITISRDFLIVDGHFTLAPAEE